MSAPPELKTRLRYAVLALAEQYGPSNVVLAQAWIVSEPGPASSSVQLHAEPGLCVLSSADFVDFRQKSCSAPLHYNSSMPGRVWRTGAVQVIQQLRIIPPTLHPRSRLRDDLLDQCGELLYVPVHDLARPTRNPVAVIECFLASRAPRMGADIISFVGGALTAVALSLSSPLPQPVRKSALCGRRHRPAEASSSGDEAAAEPRGQSHHAAGPAKGPVGMGAGAGPSLAHQHNHQPTCATAGGVGAAAGRAGLGPGSMMAQQPEGASHAVGAASPADSLDGRTSIAGSAGGVAVAASSAHALSADGSSPGLAAVVAAAQGGDPHGWQHQRAQQEGGREAPCCYGEVAGSDDVDMEPEPKRQRPMGRVKSMRYVRCEEGESDD